ncbi:MAG: hypothetical protein NC483_02080 [Ruminococcus sp.]|nr:hypothetical protein [Ruminococcus sp.]
MKKLFLTIMVVLCLILLPKEVYAKNKVTVYIFRGYDCPHCEEALEAINEHKDEFNDNIEIITYEVWKNANNSKLQDAVAKKLNIDTESDNYGIPLIVIGDEYIIGGSSTTYKRIIEIAEDFIDNDEYKDVVKEAINELSIEIEPTTLKDIFPEPNKVVTIIVYVIFGVAIIGFVSLIVFSRKN